jgi:FKBP-type peptidyl-prolyl cis-trans isomerase
VAEMTAERRAKTRRTVVRVVVAAVVILGALFAYSALTGDDGGDSTDTAADETTTSVADSTTTTVAYSNPELAEEVLGREAPDPEPPPEDTPRDAIESETLIDGSGDTAVAAGDTVTVHYIGKVPDGSVFDSSWERGEPATFPIGQGEVIPGWDEGLIGAKIGERRRLVIGSDNAYGEQGRPDGGIPANSPLAFEIDIVDITQGAPAGGSGG